jgi:type I restriction enzyme S subunit
MNGGLSMVEMKSGYKMTEVGVIPEDWEVKELSSISAIKSGKRLPKGSLVASSKTSYPYIRVIDMNMGYLNLSNIMYVPENVQPMISKYIISKNDIYISVAGTLGLVGKIPEELDGANLTENANRITEIQCNRDYLMYYMMSPLIQNVIEAERTIGAQPKLALQRIRDFYIVLPRDNREQTAIAAALSDVDSLISALTKKIEKKKAIKQGLMQQLLTGKKRLSGFNDKWKSMLLGDIAEVKDGTHQTPQYVKSGGKPFYSVENVTADDFKNVKHISLEEHKALTSNYRIEKGDVLMTRIGSIGCCKYVDWDVDASFYVSLALLKINEKYDSKFISYLSNIKSFKEEVMLNSLVFAIPQKINLGNISLIKVYIPTSKAEQTAIANILSDCDSEIAALEEKRDKYKEIKQGMMQQLLTGKIRLIK